MRRPRHIRQYLQRDLWAALALLALCAAMLITMLVAIAEAKP